MDQKRGKNNPVFLYHLMLTFRLFFFVKLEFCSDMRDQQNPKPQLHNSDEDKPDYNITFLKFCYLQKV